MLLKNLIMLIVLIAVFTAPVSSQQYGTTDFHASGDPRAHAVFIRGLVMLHNFEYEDARETFRQAREVDPDFVMAYWGEALTHEHPLWNQQNLSAARAVLEQLAPTAGERDYAYSAVLKTISETWPEDVEEARRLVGYAEREWKNADTPTNRIGFITCRSNYIIDTQAWDDPLLELEVGYEKVWPSAIAMDQYVMGLRALRRGDTGQAGAIVDALVRSANPDSKNIRAAAPTVLKLLLQGRTLIAAGKQEQGLALMQQAVDLEQTLAPAIGPAMPQPAAEALADVYRELGNLTLARENYQLSLVRAVQRRRSLEGLQATGS